MNKKNIDKKQIRELKEEIYSLKTKLYKTDYQAIKYAEEVISSVEYLSIKE